MDVGKYIQSGTVMKNSFKSGYKDLTLNFKILYKKYTHAVILIMTVFLVFLITLLYLHSFIAFFLHKLNS